MFHVLKSGWLSAKVTALELLYDLSLSPRVLELVVERVELRRRQHFGAAIGMTALA